MPRRHLFVCTNTRSSGKPACGARGGAELQADVSRLLIERDATDVLVTATACLGPCFDGPNAVVYPDAVWYGGLAVEDAPAIARHLVDGVVHAEKVVPAPGSADRDD
ncbi:MAG: ferredoxin [Kofleriaceae bacterium]